MSRIRLIAPRGVSILKPMPPPLFAAIALIVLVAGAAYWPPTVAMSDG